MGYNSEVYRRYYRAVPERHVAYVLRISGKNIWKCGSTNRLQFRLKNLRQALYEDSEVYTLIPCCCRKHASDMEKQLHATLSAFRLQREWYACTEDTLNDYIAAFIGNGYECSPPPHDAQDVHHVSED